MNSSGRKDHRFLLAGMVPIVLVSEAYLIGFDVPSRRLFEIATRWV